MEIMGINKITQTKERALITATELYPIVYYYYSKIAEAINSIIQESDPTVVEDISNIHDKGLVKHKGAVWSARSVNENDFVEAGTIVVKGGTFTGFNPADCACEGEGTNFVAEGFTVTEDNGVFTVVAE